MEIEEEVLHEIIYQKFKNASIMYKILKEELGIEVAEKDFRDIFDNVMTRIAGDLKQ